MTSSRRRLPRPAHVPVAAVAAAVLLALALAGCSAGSGSDDALGSSADSGAGSGEVATRPAPAAAAEADGPGRAQQSGGLSDATDEPLLDGGRDLVKTGNVALRSDDVEQARFAVKKVLLRHRGELGRQETEADGEGGVDRALLELRVPVDAFDDTMTDLEEVGDLLDSSSNVEDVTRQVVDVGVRVRVQRHSIERIEALLDRATGISAVVAVERELARREASLSSLLRQQAALADQTAMSTITVSLERAPEKDEDAPPPDPDDEGFLAGLTAGWTALGDVTTGVLTVTGAVLPFALLLALLALLARPVVRRRRAAAQPTG